MKKCVSSRFDWWPRRNFGNSFFRGKNENFLPTPTRRTLRTQPKRSRERAEPSVSLFLVGAVVFFLNDDIHDDNEDRTKIQKIVMRDAPLD